MKNRGIRRVFPENFFTFPLRRHHSTRLFPQTLYHTEHSGPCGSKLPPNKFPILLRTPACELANQIFFYCPLEQKPFKYQANVKLSSTKKVECGDTTEVSLACTAEEIS